MAYLRLSAGIGAGLVINGRPFRGARGIAGEIGHVLVDPQGPICRCGNRGCLETFVAGPALCELLRRSHGPLSTHQLLELAREGDAGCQRVIADAGRVVGRAVADLCNYLNPDLVVVGGDLSAAGDLVLEPMREAVRRFAIPAAAEDVEIVAGTLGDRAELLGALGPRRPRVRRPTDRSRTSHVPSHRRRKTVMHSPISRRAPAIGSALCALTFGVAACGSDDDNGSSSGTSSGAAKASTAQKVGVLLPDTKSSVRWESFDRPLLEEAFKSAGVPVTIENAQGDKSTQQQQAEQPITNGAKVLLLVDLDSGSGAAIEANAQSRGVKVIDYDRLTLKGSAAYYVSFDNVKVGKLQGQGLVDCLGRSGTANIAELNGSPTDNNATLFKQG